MAGVVALFMSASVQAAPELHDARLDSRVDFRAPGDISFHVTVDQAGMPVGTKVSAVLVEGRIPYWGVNYAVEDGGGLPAGNPHSFCIEQIQKPNAEHEIAEPGKCFGYAILALPTHFASPGVVAPGHAAQLVFDR
jgi:hypothetical protein